MLKYHRFFYYTAESICRFRIFFFVVCFFSLKKIPQQQEGRNWLAELSSPTATGLLIILLNTNFVLILLMLGCTVLVISLYKFLKWLQGCVGHINSCQAPNEYFCCFQQCWSSPSEVKGSPHLTQFTWNSSGKAPTAFPNPNQLITAPTPQLDLVLVHTAFLSFGNKPHAALHTIISVWIE